MKTRIVFPELENPIIKSAIEKAREKFPDFELVGADSLEHACLAVRNQLADSLIAGIDYSSRDVILACRDLIGVKNPRNLLKPTFSASFILERENETYILADAAACKHPTPDQLYDIAVQTVETASKIFPVPKVAFLSFSTKGSGGRDDTIDLIQETIAKLKISHPELLVDGELQLDAAINPRIGQKKAPDSPVAGFANTLIVPDLNTGNILYKAMEQFGGFVAAGPILQGFNAPISDLSRGSTEEDVLKVIEYMLLLAKH